jgi:hypothetical protein
MINRKAVIMPILVLLSIQGVVGSIIFFEKKSEKITDYLTMETGKVAGKSTSKIIDLTKEIPMIPNAEIASVDTFQNSASVTLQSLLPEEEIRTYYDDFMLLNDWEQIGENNYQRNDKQLHIEITGNLIKLTLTRL